VSNPVNHSYTLPRTLTHFLITPHLFCQNAALFLSVELIMCLCDNISESWDCSFCFSRRIFLDKAGIYKDFCHWDIVWPSVSHRPDSLCLCLSLHPLSSTLDEDGIFLFSDWVHIICIFIWSNSACEQYHYFNPFWALPVTALIDCSPLDLGTDTVGIAGLRDFGCYWAGKLQLIPQIP